MQNLADNAVDEHTSISIINASGFDLKNKGVKVKSDLTVKNGAVSGSVNLAAKSVDKRSASNWRKSLDHVTWTELPPTLQARTTVTGLTPGNTVYFQYRAITKTGAGDWSQAVGIVVQ